MHFVVVVFVVIFWEGGFGIFFGGVGGGVSTRR